MLIDDELLNGKTTVGCGVDNEHIHVALTGVIFETSLQWSRICIFPSKHALHIPDTCLILLEKLTILVFLLQIPSTFKEFSSDLLSFYWK